MRCAQISLDSGLFQIFTSWFIAKIKRIGFLGFFFLCYNSNSNDFSPDMWKLCFCHPEKFRTKVEQLPHLTQAAQAWFGEVEHPSHQTGWFEIPPASARNRNYIRWDLPRSQMFVTDTHITSGLFAVDEEKLILLFWMSSQPPGDALVRWIILENTNSSAEALKGAEGWLQGSCHWHRHLTEMDLTLQGSGAKQTPPTHWNLTKIWEYQLNS